MIGDFALGWLRKKMWLSGLILAENIISGLDLYLILLAKIAGKSLITAKISFHS
jgi:hypothetical protein